MFNFVLQQGPTGPTGPGITVGNAPLYLSGPTGSSLYLSYTSPIISTGPTAASIGIDVGTGSTQVAAGNHNHDINTLTGTTLPSGVVTSSLTSVGTLTNLSVTNTITGSVSGSASSATSAGKSTNLAGGLAGQVPYQSAADTTAFLATGPTGSVMTSNGTAAPTWTGPSSLSVGSATTATHIAGGSAGQVQYQSGAGATSFVPTGPTGAVMTANGTAAPTWTGPSSLTTGKATNVAGGTAGQVHYQSAADTTAFVPTGPTGSLLSANGAAAPTWVNRNGFVIAMSMVFG